MMDSLTTSAGILELQEKICGVTHSIPRRDGNIVNQLLLHRNQYLALKDALEQNAEDIVVNKQKQ